MIVGRRRQLDPQRHFLFAVYDKPSGIVLGPMLEVVQPTACMRLVGDDVPLVTSSESPARAPDHLPAELDLAAVVVEAGK
jgi:hypothetical protein